MSNHQNKAVESLYTEHKDHVYNYILQLAQDKETAEDVTQNTFLKLLDDPNIENLEYPKAYLFTVARNLLKDQWKKKKELPLLDDNSEAELQDEGITSEPEKLSLDDSVANSLHITIKRMPTKQRELMLLRYRDDLSYQEIVDITGRNLSDIKVGLHRARQNFDKKFTHEMYAKIAGERKHCAEIEKLLANINQRSPSDADINLVSKHIEKCAICAEDESTQKKRRKLFALFPFFTASIFFNDAMREAHAGTMTHTSKGSQAPQPEQGATTSSLLQTGLSKISAAAIVIGISSAVILGTMNTKDDGEDPQTAPEDAAVQTSEPQTSPSPTPQLPDIGTQAIKAQEIEANVAEESEAPELPQDKPGSDQLKESIALVEDKTQISTTSSSSSSQSQTGTSEQDTTTPQKQKENIPQYKGPSFTAVQTQVFSDGERESNKVAYSPHGMRMNILGGGSEFLWIYGKRECAYINNTQKVYSTIKMDSEGNCDLEEDNTSSAFEDILPEMSEEERAEWEQEDTANDGLFWGEACPGAKEKKVVGGENISGYGTIKRECTYGSGAKAYYWFSNELGITIKNEAGGITTELHNIQTEDIPKEFFSIPKDYRSISTEEFMSLLSGYGAR